MRTSITNVAALNPATQPPRPGVHRRGVHLDLVVSTPAYTFPNQPRLPRHSRQKQDVGDNSSDTLATTIAAVRAREAVVHYHTALVANMPIVRHGTAASGSVAHVNLCA